MRKSFPNPRARIFLLIAAPLAVVLGLSGCHAIDGNESQLVELALLVLTFAAVWLGRELFFGRRIDALRAADTPAKGDLAARAYNQQMQYAHHLAPASVVRRKRRPPPRTSLQRSLARKYPDTPNAAPIPG